jgi:hypothetical protein
MTVDKETKTRVKNQKELMLNLLRNAGDKGVLNSALSQVALQYSKRLSELYYMGYKIKNEELGGGVVRYTLISEPSTIIKSRPRASDVLVDRIKELGSVNAEQFLGLLEELRIGIKYNSGVYKI